MRTKSAILDRSRFSTLAATCVLDTGRLPCQNRMRRSATFLMAYSLQPIMAVDTNCWSSNAPLGRKGGGGSYAADLVPQLPAHVTGSVALHSIFVASTE